MIDVLRAPKAPKSAAEIHAAIVDRGLYDFKAKDAIGVIRSAIRKHLRSHGGAGQPPSRVTAVDRDRYTAS
ncbi:MAG: hypothetical protein HYV09_03310 [Deltaproteobacteria bacterium]|nr:hypothetical protein [Deltaproteobacteria bacterium]